MIFIDANIPMYLIGAEHPHKRDAITILERLVSEKARLVTNTEVLQEIFHRYTFLQKKDFMQLALDALYEFIDEIFVVTEVDCWEAKDLLLAYQHLSARDAVHAAHMKRLKIDKIFSFDSGFDLLPGFERIPSSKQS